MNVIFLDIDGVLNSHEYLESMKGIHGFVEIDKTKLPNLKEIADLFDAKIVLSSTWKYLDDPEYPSGYSMWIYLINSLTCVGLEIYDKTPDLHGKFQENLPPIDILALDELPRNPEIGRPAEIKAWLDTHENVDYWISIDDDFSEEAYEACGIGGHLLQTSFWGKAKECGLQPFHVKKAKQVLGRQKNLQKHQSL